VEDTGPIPQAHPERVASGPTPDAEPVPPPEPWMLRALHEIGENDLLNPERFGYVRDVDHVAGFQPHRFTKLPELEGRKQLRWLLVRLELIGLLKYDRPKAYVTENLPRLDELGEAATRDVDDFEQAALTRLQTDQDVVIDESPTEIRMVGSLRAGNDCLECHSVRRGELIGALTYRLIPHGTPPPAENAVASRSTSPQDE
ncbi:MAG TPA: hypothetical protein VMF30_13595, partial [Pirellulales bacterium]|nr:hypothetical protein [Pirellulales bacterium]